ncbi:hypothetical protein PsorP6_012467 [Peronosclerospora sorghi]|uniref:Uncharacterized protein n=1 Tax=Peronosclerospora sorghi TaxID=230839 RepID=A0ACC0WEA5_9STRA|nr:hypothetical protein PsorP6_012467 [Peronosclerospora sorghi]
MTRSAATLGTSFLLSTLFVACHSFTTNECENPPTHAALRRSDNVSSSAEILYPNCTVVTIRANVDNGNTSLDATNLEIQIISSFPNVTEILLSGNEVKTIYEDTNTSLKTLDLSRNGLTRLTNLIIPTSVTTLYVHDASYCFKHILLDGNALTSLDDRDLPDTITSLSLTHNGIQSLSAFSFSDTLQELNTSGNVLTDLSHWQLPSHLATFSCRTCHIQNLSGLTLPPRGSLTTLDLEGSTVDAFEIGRSSLPLIRDLHSFQLRVSTSACTDPSASTEQVQSVPLCVLPDAVYNEKFVLTRNSRDAPSSSSEAPSVETLPVDTLPASSWMFVAMISGAVLLFLLFGGTIGYFVFHYRRARNENDRDDPVDRHSVGITSYSIFERTLNTGQRDTDENRTSKFRRRLTSTTNSSMQSLLTSGERPLETDIRIDAELQQFRLRHDEVARGDLIAQGGYGAVYRATCRRHHYVVVMKQLLPEHVRNCDLVSAFMDEIRICASLAHPKIVKFIGFTYTSLLDLSAVFEYMPHGDLATLLETQLKRETLDPRHRALFTWFSATHGECHRAKVHLALDMVEALVYLHSFATPMIHRDLKPKNILLSETWDAKVTDFGTSRAVQDDQTMTAEIGTVSWIAPEVLRGERYSEKADVYSLGVILSELDTCRRPYSDTEVVPTDKILRQKPTHTNTRIAVLVSAGTLRPSLSADCPKPVETLIQTCLENNPLHRPSAAHVHHELQSLTVAAATATSRGRKQSDSAIVLIEATELALLSNESRAPGRGCLVVAILSLLCRESYAASSCPKSGIAPPRNVTLTAPANGATNVAILVKNAACDEVTIKATPSDTRGEFRINASYVDLEIVESYPAVASLYVQKNSIHERKSVFFFTVRTTGRCRWLWNNKIRTFKAVGTSVTEVDITSNQLTSLKGLTFPASVLMLTLDLNALTTTRASEFPENLQRLYLRKNSIASLATFRFSSSLQQLYLNGNQQLTSFQGAVFPDSLQQLECSDCRITEFVGVVIPKNLKKLTLGGTTITTFIVRQSDVKVLQSAQLSLTVSMDATSCSGTMTLISTDKSVCVLNGTFLVQKDVFFPTILVFTYMYFLLFWCADLTFARLYPVTNSESADTSGSSSQADLGNGTGSTNEAGGSALIPAQKEDKKSSGYAVVIGASAAGTTVFFVIVGFVLYRRRQRSREPSGEDFLVFSPSKRLSKSERDGLNTDSPTATLPPSSDSGYLSNDVRNDENLIPFRLPLEDLVIQEELASGGFGVVYLALMYGQQVVMKRILPKVMSNTLLRRFMDEIRLSARMDHPKIVHFIGVAWTNLLDLSLVVEFLPHGDLTTLLRQKRQEQDYRRAFSWLDATSHPRSKVELALDIIDAVVYLHSFNPTIIHRDLKTRNILLSHEWDAKLSDFGISRETSETSTMTGGMGTIAWIAPEVLQGQRYSERADIFSLGIVLSEMDTCGHPYNSNRTEDGALTDAKIALLVTSNAIKPTIEADCPRAIHDLILQLQATTEPTEFHVLTPVLGHGSFGTVRFARHCRTGLPVAMKIVPRTVIQAYQQEQHIAREQSVHLRLEHPFIATLYATFQDRDAVYFIVEFCPGGELYRLVNGASTEADEQVDDRDEGDHETSTAVTIESESEDEATRVGRGGSSSMDHTRRLALENRVAIQKLRTADGGLAEEHVAFYAACVVLALEYVHARGILYRDLKLENVMLDRHGYPKVIDFGGSKPDATIARSGTLCGSPAYMAPEMLRHESYDERVDIWSFGILVYELLFGVPPFQAANPREQCRRVLDDPLTFVPEYEHTHASVCALLRHALAKDPRERLASFTQVRDTPFFRTYFPSRESWRQVETRGRDAPFVPRLSGPLDTSLCAWKAEDEEGTEEATKADFDY